MRMPLVFSITWRMGGPRADDVEDLRVQGRFAAEMQQIQLAFAVDRGSEHASLRRAGGDWRSGEELAKQVGADCGAR